MSTLSPEAKRLHAWMCESAPGTLFGQSQLLEYLQLADPQALLLIAQDLMNNNLIKLIKQGEDLKFQALSVSEASKITSMNPDEAMIYSYIEASGREGVWTKTIRAKTNLHQHIVVRCLKSLENQQYIKSIKSVKHPTRKIYMLYHLQPSIDVTGGPWFTDSELDSEFIDSLLTVIWRYVASKTYPTAFQPPAANVNVLQALYPYNHTGFVNINQIMDFIVQSNITNIGLATHDIRALCDVLVYDDKIELVGGTVDHYKATWQSILDAGYGQQYKEQMTPEIKAVLQNQAFLIFNNRGDDVIDEEESDLVYFDAWIYN